MGTAFFDRSRCLPWAKNLPCILCQENCPVSPKAIYTDEIYSTVRDGVQTAYLIKGKNIILKQNVFSPQKLSTGDYFVVLKNKKYKITNNTADTITTAANLPLLKNTNITIQIRLQRPYMDISKCIGCGICEHECPVHGKKAVRISAEGETRSPEKRLLLRNN